MDLLLLRRRGPACCLAPIVLFGLLTGCRTVEAKTPSATPPVTETAATTPVATPSNALSPAPSPSSTATPTANPSYIPSPTAAPRKALPDGFCYLSDVAPDIVVDLQYAGTDNFTGAVVDGYHDAQSAVLATTAAEALSRVQDVLKDSALGLKVYDAYRPQKAVDCFLAWAEDEDDPADKARFYPHVKKSSLFSQGYIARRSGHSRGSTVDVTLVSLDSGQELDMGTPVDFLDPLARHGADGLTKTQTANRKTLKTAMTACGFVSYHKEWWHYTFEPEAFPDTYFDFDVE